MTADLVGEYLFTDADFINNLSTNNRNVFQKIYDEIKYLCKVVTAGSKEARELEKVKRAFEKAYKADSKAKNDKNYHISEVFSEEIDKALNGTMSENSQVKARDFTPQVLVENGVSDLPMLITQRHVKSTIYTEAEAKALGLKTGGNNHYHGLGKETLMEAIDGMDNPSEIYKQDDNHYLFITEVKSSDGNNIIVPVRVDGKGTYNDVYIDENQISSVYGKKNLADYLARNNFEKVYENSETALNPGVQFSDISSSANNSIAQSGKKSTGKTQYSFEFSETIANEDILALLQKVQRDPAGYNQKDCVSLGVVDNTIAEKIKQTIGVDPTGYEVVIEARQIKHILNDHGPNGSTDQSMADPASLSKIEYTLREPDEISDGGITHAYFNQVNGKNRPVRTVLYERSVTPNGDSMYVVQAVPVSSKKKLYIVTAFMGESGYKNRASQFANANGPGATANTAAGNALIDNVAQTNQNVKGQYSLNKVTEDGLTMTYVRVPNQNTQNYGSTYGQNIEPAGEYMSMDTVEGKNKIDGYEYGTIQFKKPLVLEHINTSDTGWKKTVSDMYNGLTGKKLTKALIKDGYDAIVTYDKYGYREIVNLNGKKLNGQNGNVNQIKSVANQKPTADAGIRFSLSKTVEETQDLVAVRNMHGSELLKTLELGGLPMPSIAVIKAKQGHEGYGDVSIIFPKEAIDPKANKANKVYGGDIWTPTYPKIEYKPNAKIERRTFYESITHQWQSQGSRQYCLCTGTDG